MIPLKVILDAGFGFDDPFGDDDFKYGGRVNM